MTETDSRMSALGVVRRYAILAYGAFGTMLDIGLMVLGSLLVGLSIAVLLGGFELVGVQVGLATGPMLASVVVLAIVGLFCVGLASEGPLGRGRHLVGYSVWEVAIGRVLALLVIGLAGLWIHETLAGFVDGLPEPFHRGVSGIRAVAIVGMTVMPLVGIPLAMATKHPSVEQAWIRLAEVPVMFVVWAVGVLIVL